MKKILLITGLVLITLFGTWGIWYRYFNKPTRIIPYPVSSNIDSAYISMDSNTIFITTENGTVEVWHNNGDILSRIYPLFSISGYQTPITKYQIVIVTHPNITTTSCETLYTDFFTMSGNTTILHSYWKQFVDGKNDNWLFIDLDLVLENDIGKTDGNTYLGAIFDNYKDDFLYEYANNFYWTPPSDQYKYEVWKDSRGEMSK